MYVATQFEICSGEVVHQRETSGLWPAKFPLASGTLAVSEMAYYILLVY